MQKTIIHDGKPHRIKYTESGYYIRISSILNAEKQNVYRQFSERQLCEIREEIRKDAKKTNL